MLVYSFKPKDEASYATKNIEDLVEQIRGDVTDGGWLSEAGQSITIEVLEMSEEEFENLGEFAGW